jgi:hypothetical protein
MSRAYVVLQRFKIDGVARGKRAQASKRDNELHYASFHFGARDKVSKKTL